MSKKPSKGVLKRLFSKDDNSEASSSAGATVTDKKKKKKGSILRKASTIRDSPPPDSPGDTHDPQRLSTIFSEGRTHAPTVTRAPTETDYQPNAGFFDEGSVRGASEIHIHDHGHEAMTSPTSFGGPWNTSPEHTQIPLYVPPSRNASVRQAPSAITRHGTVIHDHGSLHHAPGGSVAAGMGGSFRGTPSHVPIPDSVEGHTLRTHKSMRSQRTHRSSAQHDAPIYVHGGPQDGFEPIVVNAGAPSASGNGNYYVVDPAGHQRNASIPRQPTVITPANAGETVLKPGDTMEIDPTNPPIFMLDDGVELEIDNGNGFVPYEEFMEEFRSRPPPPPPSTFVVHGAGDVIIQDEHGNHIQTIPGRGAEAGRGQPQRYNSPHSNLLSPHSPRSPEDALSPSWGERPLSYPSAMGGSMPTSPRWEDGAPSPEPPRGSQEGEQEEEDVANLSILRTPPTISVSRAPSLRRRRSDSDASSGSECSSASWGRTEADRYSRDFDAKSFRFSQYSTSMSKDWDVEVGNGKRSSRDFDVPQAGSRKSLIRKSSLFAGLRPPFQRPDKSISPLFATLDLPPPPTFVPRVQSPPLASSQSQSQSQAELPAPRRRETVGVTAADRKNRVESKYLPSIRHALERKISFGSFASMAKEILPKPTTESQAGIPTNPSHSPTSPISPAEPAPERSVVKIRTKKLPSPTRPVPTAPTPTKPLSINTRKANDVKAQHVKSPGLSVTSPKPNDVVFQPIFQSLAFPSMSTVDLMPPAPPGATKQGYALKHKGRLNLDAPVRAPSKAPAPAVDTFQPNEPEPIAPEPKPAYPIIQPTSKNEIERLKHETDEAATPARLAKEKEESGRLQKIREEIEAKQRVELEARIKAEVEAKIRTEFEERERERQRLREEDAARLAAELEAAKKLKEEQEMARLEREAAEEQRLVAQREAEAAKALEAELERARLEEDRLRTEEAAREAARLQATRVAELERRLLEAQRQDEVRRGEEERERKKQEDAQREQIRQEKQLAVEREIAEKAAEERRRKEEQEQIERQRRVQDEADRLARLEEEIRERERQITLQRKEAERREKEIQAELERERAEVVKRETEAREREEEEKRLREAELVRIAAEHERRRKEEIERLENELKQRMEREAEKARRKALQVAGQALSTSIPPPPPPPPPPYVPLSVSEPARLVTNDAAVPSIDKNVDASIPPPPPPPPPPYVLNKSVQKLPGVLPTSVQLKPVPRPAISQSPTKDDPSSAPPSAKEGPRERRISLLDRTKTQVSTVPIQLPIIPAFRARTTSHVRSNTSPVILSLIEKCAAGTNGQSGPFSAGSKALTPTLTGATLTNISMASGTSHDDIIEFMPSSPSDTAATVTIAPPTPTQPINIEAKFKPSDVETHEQDKYDDTASPVVVESANKDIFIETSVTERSTLPKGPPPTTASGPLDDLPIDRVPSTSTSLDTPLPETTPTSATVHHPSTPSLKPAIPSKPASLEPRSSHVRRSSSIIALRSIFDKPAASDPTYQAAPVQEIVAGAASPRKVPPPLAPKPKSSIARLSAVFEQQQSLVSPRWSIPTTSQPDTPPALKINASLPAPNPEAYSLPSVVDSTREGCKDMPSAESAVESSSPMARAPPLIPLSSAEAIPSKVTEWGVANLMSTSSIGVPDAIELESSPLKVSDLVKAIEASQPTSTEIVEVAPTPPIKPKPILAPKPVGLVRSFSFTRATLVSPDPSNRATPAGTPSPRIQTSMLSFDAPVPVAPSRRGSTAGKVAPPPPLAPKPNLMSRRQSTSIPVPPLSSPLPDTKPGAREEPAVSITPIKPSASTSSDRAAPLFPASSLSTSLQSLSYGPTAPGNHGTSVAPSAAAFEQKLDDKEEVKIMEMERIEAETRRLQEDQQAVVRARLEEENRERDKIAKETMESELKRRLEEKRRAKTDTSKPWIKRKPKREEIDPMILASLESLESRSTTPLPLPEPRASTPNGQEDNRRPSHNRSSVLAQVDTDTHVSNEPFVLAPMHVPEACPSPIAVVLDEKNMVASNREQVDVAAPAVLRSSSLVASRRGSATSKAPSPPPLAPKPKFRTKSQATTPAPTALIIPTDAPVHTPVSTNECLLGHAMSIEPSAAVPVIPDCTLCDSPRRLSPRELSSEQNEANNPRLSSMELLAEKMLERERVWSMDSEQLEAMAIQLADGEDSAAERARVEEEKREQERMSFEVAELQLRRKQEEKRKVEMEVKPLVESSNTRKRQSGPPSGPVVGRTPSSSKEITQATVGSALQTRRKGVPAGLIVPPPEVLNERSPADHLPPGTTLGYSFTLLKPSSEPSPPALSLMRVSEVTVIAQKSSPEDVHASLPSTDSKAPTQRVEELLTNRSSIIPPAPSPKPFSLVSRRLSSGKPSMGSHPPSRPSSRTSMYDFGWSHDFIPAAYPSNTSFLEPHTHARKSSDPAPMAKTSRSPRPLSPMHTGISVSSPIPIPSDLVTTAHGMPSSLPCHRKPPYPPLANNEATSQAVHVPRASTPYSTDAEPSSSPAISEDSFVTAPTRFATPTESFADLAALNARSPSPPLSLAVVFSTAPKFKAIVPPKRASLHGPSPVWITGTMPIPITRDVEKEREQERETGVKLALRRERARKSVSLPVPARTATSTFSSQRLIQPAEELDAISGAIMPRWNDYASSGFLSSSPSSTRPSTPAFSSSPSSRHSPQSPPRHAVMATLNPAHLPGGSQHVEPLRRTRTKQLEWDGRKFEVGLPGGRPRGRSLIDRAPSPQAVALGNAVKAYISPAIDKKKRLP